MKFYLSIDGGGTKTKFLLCDESGEKLATSIQPTSHYLQCGYDGVAKVIHDGLVACLTLTSLPASSITYCFVAAAGYNDIPKDNQQIENAVRQSLGTIPFSIGNDTDNALAGGLGGACGINIIAGTGSIALGLDNMKNTYRCGGWHHIFGGDEGSGYWFGCNLLREYSRQYDRRDNRTQLYDYMVEKHGYVTCAEMLDDVVVKWSCDRTKIASLSMDVYELAKANDPFALAIYRKGANELADLIYATYRNLSFDNQVNVSYTGGMFKSGSLLLAPLRELLPKETFHLTPPLMQPDEGGIILAMQSAGEEISSSILKTLILIK